MSRLYYLCIAGSNPQMDYLCHASRGVNGRPVGAVDVDRKISALGVLGVVRDHMPAGRVGLACLLIEAVINEPLARNLQVRPRLPRR